MTAGIVKINGRAIVHISKLPVEFTEVGKLIKKTLIEFMVLQKDFDFDNDSVSYELNLGEGFYATFYKTSQIRK